MTDTSSLAQMIAGDTEGALRHAVASVQGEPGDLASAALITKLLADAGRDGVDALRAKLAAAFVDAGDLPGATAVALDGGALADSLKAIAAAFGKGSTRVANVSLAPPPLPQRRTITPEISDASGDALLALAEQSLGRALPDSDGSARVPGLPLFNELDPKDLAQLLGAFEVRYVGAGDALIEEKDEGREAFVLVRGTLEVTRGEGDAQTTLAKLRTGSIFGEMALVSDAPRAAAVRAQDAAIVLAIGRSALEKLAGTAPAIGKELGHFCQKRMLENLMRASAILGAVAPEDRAELVSRFETRSFDAGAQMVKRGDEGQSLFLIASGGVVIHGKDSDGDTIQLARLGPGDVVGEIALVLRRPATADVVAEHPTIALELTRDAFQEAIRQHPTLLGELYDIAVKRDEETRSVVAQQALDVSDVVLI